jgi:fumarate reductase flavoprotein subunit
VNNQWDVIVAGGGTAGMALAICAAQRGGRVLVVERNRSLGGTLQVSSGQLSAAGTRLQVRRAIHDTAQLHFDDAQRISRGSADGRYLRKVIDHGAETLHWLLDSGFEVMPDHPIVYYAHEPYQVPRTYFGPKKAIGILESILPLYQAQERAGRIKTLLETKVLGVTQSDSGAITGIRFCDVKGGGDTGAVAESGKNIVLAMGGYARHAERFRKWTGGRSLYSWGYEYARGDGHQIGLDAGGSLKHGEKYLCTFAGVRNPADPSNVNVLTALTPQMRDPWEMYINLEGRRFMREDHPSVDARERALLAQPEMSFWAVYDQGMVDRAPKPFVVGVPPDSLTKVWNELPSFQRAATLPDLAAGMRIDTRALLQSVHDYNLAVANGDDRQFDRVHLPQLLGRPPYYAVLHHGLSVCGWAGLDTDDDLRVLNTAGTPIHGLYAVGEQVGFGRANGNAFIGGMGLQPALTMGRLLGQRILQW